MDVRGLRVTGQQAKDTRGFSVLEFANASIFPDPDEPNVGVITLFPGSDYRYVLEPSGDTTGATDSNNIDALQALVTAAGSGTIQSGRGPFYINRRHTFINMDLQGNGAGAPTAATVFNCTTPTAGIWFGNQSVISRHGVSGGFTVDGHNLATAPFGLGVVVCSTFMGIDSYRSAGAGIQEIGAQNNTLINVHSTRAATIAYYFDGGAASNHHYNAELDSPGLWMVKYDNIITPFAGLPAVPTHNSFTGGNMERVATAGGIWQKAGERNGSYNINMALDGHSAGSPFVRTDSGLYLIDGGVYQSNLPLTGIGVTTAAGSQVIISGHPAFSGQATIFNNDGAITLDSEVQPIAYTNYRTGANGLTRASTSTNTGLGTIPLVSGLSQALTTTLAALAGGLAVLDPAEWPAAAPGGLLQYRYHALGFGLTAADVLDAQGFATGIGFDGAHFTSVTDANGVAEAVSAWLTFPVSRKSVSVLIRNSTAARGFGATAFIDVRSV